MEDLHRFFESGSQGNGFEQYLQHSEGQHQAACDFIASLGSMLNDDEERKVNNGGAGDGDTSQWDNATSNVIREVQDKILELGSVPEQGSVTISKEALHFVAGLVNSLNDHVRARASISRLEPDAVRGDFKEVEDRLTLISGYLQQMASEQTSTAEQSLDERSRTCASSVKSLLENFLANFRDGHIPNDAVIDIHYEARKGDSFADMNISKSLSAGLSETQTAENGGIQQSEDPIEAQTALNRDMQQAMQNLAFDSTGAGFDAVAYPLPGQLEGIDHMRE